MKDRYEADPCSACPYRLGIIKTLVCPCPQYREGGFKLLRDYLRRASGDSKSFVKTGESP